jgi:hypothetical protein
MARLSAPVESAPISHGPSTSQPSDRAQAAQSAGEKPALIIALT